MIVQYHNGFFQVKKWRLRNNVNHLETVQDTDKPTTKRFYD